jgi:hypothetical protein
MEDAQQALVKVEQLQSQATALRSTAACSITDFMLSMPTRALWQLQGVLEWLHVSHSPVNVLTLYHEL